MAVINITPPWSEMSVDLSKSRALIEEGAPRSTAVPGVCWFWTVSGPFVDVMCMASQGGLSSACRIWKAVACFWVFMSARVYFILADCHGNHVKLNARIRTITSTQLPRLEA
jgi:hypothetical protein